MAYGMVKKPKVWHLPECSTAQIWPWIDAEKCSECKGRQEAALRALRARFHKQERFS